MSKVLTLALAVGLVSLASSGCGVVAAVDPVVVPCALADLGEAASAGDVLPASELWLEHAGLDAVVHLAFAASHVDIDGLEVFEGSGEVRRDEGRASPCRVTISMLPSAPLRGWTLVDDHLAVLEPGDGALSLFELRSDGPIALVEIHDVRHGTHGSFVVDSARREDIAGAHVLRAAAAVVAALSAGACAEASFGSCEGSAEDGCDTWEHQLTYGCDVSTGSVQCGWTCFASISSDVHPVAHGDALAFGDLGVADLARIDALVEEADFGPVERIVGSICDGTSSRGFCKVYGPAREVTAGMVSIRSLSCSASPSTGAWRVVGGLERTYERITSAGGRVVDVSRGGNQLESLDRPTLQRIVDALEAASRAGRSGSTLFDLGLGSILCPPEVALELVTNGMAHTSSDHLLVEVVTGVTRDCAGHSDVLCVERDAVVQLGTFGVQR